MTNVSGIASARLLLKVNCVPKEVKKSNLSLNPKFSEVFHIYTEMTN